ncbi:MAG: CHASE domain-containing protein [Proteobacteria bacterium]|nr:CHASE domain-containing protein [Pseudomonadota bacterium]
MNWPKQIQSRLTHARAWGLALLVFVGCMLLTVVAQHAVRRAIDHSEQVTHSREADRLSAEISRRLIAPVLLLRSTRSLYATVPDISREAFSTYVRQRDLNRDQPGVRGVGWVRAVPRAQLEAYVAAQRASGAPNFAIRVLSPEQSDPLLVVERVEPPLRNAVAMGLDVASENTRLTAALRAADTGDDALTDVIALVQDGLHRPGFHLYSPLYRQVQPDGSVRLEASLPQASAAQRRASLAGLVYVPLVAAEWLEGVSEASSHMLDFDLLVHAPGVAQGKLAYAERNGRWESAPAALGDAADVRDIVIAGVTMRLLARPTQAALAAIDYRPVLATQIVGLMASMGMAIITWLVMLTRHQTQSALRDSQALLDRAGRIASVGGWSFLPPGQVFEWTAETRRIFDFPPGHQPRLEDVLALIHEDDRPSVRIGLKRALAGIGGWDTEVRARTVGGTPLWIRIIGEPMKDTQGLRVVGAMQDVSSRRALQDELQRHNELLQGAIDALDEAFVLYDARDRLVLCNEKYREVYPLASPAMVRGARFEDIIRFGAERGEYVDAKGRIEDWVAERLAAHRQKDGKTMLQRLSSGRVLRVKERHLPDGHTVGFRIDVTDLQRATDEARAASEAKSRFMANLSHEIRTPMNAILGLLTLLQRTELLEVQRGYTRKIEGSARWMLQLLNDILDFAKAEAGKTVLEAKAFRLDKLLQELSVIAHGNVGDSGLAVRFDLDPNLPAGVVGDALRVQQVLTNLVGNAIKFTPHGEVCVRVRVTDRTADKVALTFAVRDTGIGIAPEHQEQIFSGFTQAESTITRRFGGTGLGLSISKRLVESMGGKLTLLSAVGKGSTFAFTLSLPLADAADLPTPAPEPAPPLPGGGERLSGMAVLLVEDNPNNQLVARELLQSEGARIQVAENGRQALDLLRGGQRFDVVLMDLQMPVMDGLTATRELRKTWASDVLPVIAMTANAASTDREDCLAAGMNDHVGKPFELDVLVDTLLRRTGRVAATAAVPDPTAGVPEPPAGGGDLNAALRRFGGNRAIYHQALAQFLAQSEAECANWLPLRQSGHKAEAARLLHSAKGLAGTVGATPLARILADLETGLAAQTLDDQAVHAAWGKALDDATPQLRSWLAETAPAPPSVSRPIDPTAVQAALQSLRVLLEQDDMDALTALEALQQAYPASNTKLAELHKAVMRLDFRRAIRLCDDLLESTPA